MERVQLGGAALGLLALATALMIYEQARKNANRPLFDGRETITLYWMSYLTLLVLGLTCGLAALVR